MQITEHPVRSPVSLHDFHVVDAILLNEPDLCTELEREIIDRIVKDEVMIYKKTKAEATFSCLERK